MRLPPANAPQPPPPRSNAACLRLTGGDYGWCNGAQARRYKSVYSQALELAKQAHKAMSQAHGMLQTAMGQ